MSFVPVKVGDLPHSRAERSAILGYGLCPLGFERIYPAKIRMIGCGRRALDVFSTILAFDLVQQQIVTSRNVLTDGKN
jgi:hypothetical protein